MNLKNFAIGLIVIVALFTTTACDNSKTTSGTSQEAKNSKERVANKDNVSTTTTEKKSAKQTEYKFVKDFKEFSSDIYAEYFAIDIPKNSKLGMFTQYGDYVYYMVKHFDEKTSDLQYVDVYKYNIESGNTKKIITIKDATFAVEISATKDYLYIDQTIDGQMIVKRYDLDGKEAKTTYGTNTYFSDSIFGLGGNTLSWYSFEKEAGSEIQIIDEKTGRIITPKLKGEDICIPGARITMVKDNIIIPRKKRYNYAFSEYNINTKQEKELFDVYISKLNNYKANEEYVGWGIQNEQIIGVYNKKDKSISKIKLYEYYLHYFSFNLIGDYLFVSTDGDDIYVFDLINKTYSKFGETFMPAKVKISLDFPYNYSYTYGTRDNKFIAEPFIKGRKDVAVICLVGVKEKGE